jgi:hypothetical protein
MQKQYFNIKNGLLFPFQFQVLGYVFFAAGLFLLLINIWASLIFILLGGLVISAFSGIEFKNKSFRKYNSFLFIKSGEWQTYSAVEKVFIKKVKTSQKMYGRANQSSTIRGIKYKAFLKFEDGVTISLLENKDQKKVTERSQIIANYFDVAIVDYSD